MPPRLDRPYAKFPLNLYEEDLEWFKRTYGRGYTARIREVIHEHHLTHRQARLHGTEPYLEADLDE